MTKQEWIEEAVKVFVLNTGNWENEMEYEYCESLYETYFVEWGYVDCSYTPEEAVLEDLSYWDF